MSHDSMKKDTMSKDTMSKDGMNKGDAMSKDSMKKDDGMMKKWGRVAPYPTSTGPRTITSPFQQQADAILHSVCQQKMEGIETGDGMTRRDADHGSVAGYVPGYFFLPRALRAA